MNYLTKEEEAIEFLKKDIDITAIAIKLAKEWKKKKVRGA